MKLAFIATLGCGALALALAGCSTTATVSTPVTTATVSTSVATAFTLATTRVCVGSPTTPSILATIQLLPLNAQRQADVASMPDNLQQRVADQRRSPRRSTDSMSIHS